MTWSSTDVENYYFLRSSSTDVENRSNKVDPKNMNLDVCFPCKIKNTKCSVSKCKVSSNHRHIECTKCLRKVHIKCNNTNSSTYNHLRSNKIICINCKPDNFPFQDLSDVLFLAENTPNIDDDIIIDIRK